MYEESLKIPLLIKYPKEIPKDVVSDRLVLNLDFAPTFLDFAGLAIPDEMQGTSMKKILTGEDPDNWREEMYYHYYEYPGPHEVKRHYGIRTDKFKLIHYYYDIDEWELFDLQLDPLEMNNLYSDPEYKEVISSLKDKLNQLRKKYNDIDHKSFLPGKSFTEIDHLGIGGEVTYKSLYSKKYPGGGHNALTDGKVSVDDLSQVEDFKVWQGFEGEDMEVIIDLREITEISSVSAGFLHNTNAWIFSPDWVEFSISIDNKTYTHIGKVERMIPVKERKKVRTIYQVDLTKLPARYIKVNVKNIGLCPEWHKGDGNPAWLFADEIVVN